MEAPLLKDLTQVNIYRHSAQSGQMDQPPSWLRPWAQSSEQASEVSEVPVEAPEVSEASEEAAEASGGLGFGLTEAVIFKVAA